MIEEFSGLDCRPELRLYVNWQKPAMTRWTWEVFTGVWWRPGAAVSRSAGVSPPPDFLLQPEKFHTGVLKVRGWHGSLDAVRSAVFEELQPILSRWFDVELHILALEPTFAPMQPTSYDFFLPLLQMHPEANWKNSCTFGLHWRVRELLKRLAGRVEQYLQQRFRQDTVYCPPYCAWTELWEETFHASWC